jgi:hypothetical protein
MTEEERVDFMEKLNPKPLPPEDQIFKGFRSEDD